MIQKLDRIRRAQKYRMIACMIHGKLHYYCTVGKALKAMRLLKKARLRSTWVA